MRREALECWAGNGSERDACDMFEGLDRLTEKHEIGVIQNYWCYGRDSNTISPETSLEWYRYFRLLISDRSEQREKHQLMLISYVSQSQKPVKKFQRSWPRGYTRTLKFPAELKLVRMGSEYCKLPSPYAHREPGVRLNTFRTSVLGVNRLTTPSDRFLFPDSIVKGDRRLDT